MDLEYMTNNYPFVSCRCMTHARVSHLETSISCFLRQDYPGKKELIILNDCAEQTLVFDHPEVKIFNLESQIPTIGQKENSCIDLCAGEIIFFWDDDDFFLPFYISTYIKEMIDRKWDFIQNNYCWNWNGVSLSGPFPAQCTGFAFRKTAWNAAGKLPEINVGHEQPFLAGLKSTSLGGVISLPLSQIGYAYGWANGVYHVSGQGPDIPGQPTCVQRFRDDALARMNGGIEPTGIIQLRPQQKHVIIPCQDISVI